MKKLNEYIPENYMIVEQSNWSKILQARKNGHTWDSLRTRDGLSCIGKAIYDSNFIALNFMLEAGCPIGSEILFNEKIFSPLWECVYRNEFKLLDLLLKAGADPDELENNLKITPIYYSSEKSLYETSLVLCNHGCKPNIEIDPNPLKMWIQNLMPTKNDLGKYSFEKSDIILKLLERGARIECNENYSDIKLAKKLWLPNLDNKKDIEIAETTIFLMEEKLLQQQLKNEINSSPNKTKRKI